MKFVFQLRSGVPDKKGQMYTEEALRDAMKKMISRKQPLGFILNDINPKRHAWESSHSISEIDVDNLSIAVETTDTVNGNMLAKMLSDERKECISVVPSYLNDGNDISTFDVRIDDEKLKNMTIEHRRTLDELYVKKIVQKCGMSIEDAKKIYEELLGKFITYNMTDHITLNQFISTYNYFNFELKSKQ